MKKMVEKVRTLERQIASEQGEFAFFGLILPEECLTWDLVVSAPWLEKLPRQGIEFIASRMQQVLSRKERLMIAAIVPLDSQHPLVRAIQERELRHGPAIIRFMEEMGGTIGDLRFSRMFVLASQKLPPAKKPRKAQTKQTPRRKTAAS